MAQMMMTTMATTMPACAKSAPPTPRAGPALRRRGRRRSARMDGGGGAGSDSRGVKVMINDAFGSMGRAVAKAATAAGLQVLPVSLTGSNRGSCTEHIAEAKLDISFHGPEEHMDVLRSVKQQHPDVIVVDYTVPAAVDKNTANYCAANLDFVVGTTGGEREAMRRRAMDAGVYAVISPQMGKQVVAFQAMMELMSKEFPGAFGGYALQVVESHQATKIDTSGTAKAIVKSFQELGCKDFTVDDIVKVRDEDEQRGAMKVPEEHLLGHAYHTYTLTSPDNSVQLQFQHNVNGRAIYAEGTVDAVLFLHKLRSEESDRTVFDMVDVLRAGAMR